MVTRCDEFSTGVDKDPVRGPSQRVIALVACIEIVEGPKLVMYAVFCVGSYNFCAPISFTHRTRYSSTRDLTRRVKCTRAGRVDDVLQTTLCIQLQRDGFLNLLHFVRQESSDAQLTVASMCMGQAYRFQQDRRSHACLRWILT
jgi:hypothetical protein